MIKSEKTVKTEKIYTGGIITLEKLLIELPNMKTSNRDVIRHPGASAVIPIDDEGYVYVVKQYRKPVEKISIEIPAGKLDAGEEPLDCAVRELKEETGLTSGKMTHLFSVATTAAFCDEIIHIYMANDLREGQMHTDDDEFLTCEKIHLDKMLEMVMTGEIFDSKTIISVLLAKLSMNDIVKIG